MTTATGFLLFAVAALAANASFLSRRIFFVWQAQHGRGEADSHAGDNGDNGGDKHGGWRVLEIVVFYFLTLFLARWLEARAGAVYPQGWEFYAVTVCLFLVMGYPGFVFRYLLKHRREAAE